MTDLLQFPSFPVEEPLEEFGEEPLGEFIEESGEEPLGEFIEEPGKEPLEESEESEEEPEEEPLGERAQPLSDRLDEQLEAQSPIDIPDLDILDAVEPDSANHEATAPIDPAIPFPQREPSAQEWFLGLDIGTTGISAVLLNRSIAQLYPIYWHQVPTLAVEPNASQSASGSPEQPIEKQFRLPLAVSLTSSQQEGEAQANALIRDFKPYLNLTLPYDVSPSADQPFSSEPVLSWSAPQPTASPSEGMITLMTLRQSLQALLAPLAAEHSAVSPLQCGAVDLEEADLIAALQQLVGIIVSTPANGSDAYRFNVREALLAAQIVDRPEQILFLEESIATLLAAFAGSAQAPMQMPNGQTQHEIEWQGNTLILSAGATQTELALVQLPNANAQIPLSEIDHSHFQIRTLPYAGTAIDQDIVLQLLYPLLPEDTPARNALEQISFPVVGEPDPLKREAFQQQLRGTPAGRALLQTARALKLHLQQQNRFVVQIGQQQTMLLRQDLTTKVLLPYVQRLNRELNALLNQTQTPALTVRQVVCTGGSASLSAITRWLQQKLPNAVILQDSYAGVRSLDYIPTCSRVAYGLAALPLYPFAFDWAKHEYSDFFLMQELMHSFPSWAMTLDEVLNMLQQKGIDAVACRSRILSMLEGELPPGLVPADSEISLLTPNSQQNPYYQEIKRASLFLRELYPDAQAYRINHHQLSELNRYFELLLSNTHQPLSQPYSIVLNVSA